MPLVRYVRNANPQDRTSRLKLKSGILLLGGEPLEVSEDDYQRLQGRYVVETVGVETAVPDPPAWQPAVPQPPDPAPVASVQTTPLIPPSTPSATAVSPSEGN